MSTASRRRRTRPAANAAPLQHHSLSPSVVRGLQHKLTRQEDEMNEEAVETTVPEADHELALDTLLKTAEAEETTALAELSDAGDESSQLTELDDDDEDGEGPIDPRNGGMSSTDDEDDDDEEEEGEEEEEDDDVVDTEAETERLEISPQKLKGRVGGDESLDIEVEVEAPSDEDNTVNGKKRKRSGLNDALQTLNDGLDPARKRSAASTRGRMSLSDSLLKTRTSLTAEEDEDDIAIATDDDEDDDRDLPASSPVLLTELDSAVADAEKQADEDELSDPPEDLDVAKTLEEDDEEEDDDEEEALRSEDELARKKAAKDALEPIEKLFAIFRDKLYDEKLAALSAELETLTGPNPTHPEYLAMMKCVDQRRDEKVHIEQVALSYKLKTLDIKTVADRATMHGQYFQTVRAIREESMETLNAQFSQIQRERRQWKVKEPQYYYKFPARRSQQVINQTAVNKEVSLLSGMARYVGFPAAPEIVGASVADVDSDLRLMQVASHQQSQLAQQTQQVQHPQQQFPQQQQALPEQQYLSHQLSAQQRLNDTQAERQYIQAHAWANPDHPAHAHHMHAPSQMHPYAHTHRQPGAPGSPAMTPANNRRAENPIPSSSTTIDGTPQTIPAGSPLEHFAAHRQPAPASAPDALRGNLHNGLSGVHPSGMSNALSNGVTDSAPSHGEESAPAVGSGGAAMDLAAVPLATAES